MNIIEAAKAMQQGQRVRRRSDPLFVYFFRDDEIWMEYMGKKRRRRPSFPMDDLLAEDWEIVE